MNRLASLVVLATLAGCPGEGAKNPDRVWIALQGGSERRLQLVDFEPEPY